jgi:predicted HTH transcriptional regulator
MGLKIIADKIRELVGKNEMDAAIQMLHQLLKDSPKLDEAIVHSARHHDIMQQLRIGVIDSKQANLTKNQIRSGVLNLLNDLDKEGSFFQNILDINNLQDLDEFEKITAKIKTNRGAGTSEILKAKTAEDLEQKELNRFFSRARTQRRFAEDEIDMGDLTVQQRLLQLSLAENGHLYKGTFLCLGKINQIESIGHSAAESKFAIFRGTSRNDFLVLETVRGNLIQQYEKMIFLLQKHLPLRRDVFKSEDDFEFPFIAVKELVANAFIHRSYDLELTSAIQVELFDDRLEIKSPGLFPENLDLDNIEMSFVINPTIAAVFFLYGHIEKSGTGINRAKEALRLRGLKAPLLFQDKLQKFVKITLFK